MDKIIARLFAEFSAMYGKKFADQWSGVDPAFLRSIWAEKLSRYIDRPEVIRGALVRCESAPWPPTLPEFLNMCSDESCALVRKKLDSEPDHFALPDNRTAEERKSQQERTRASIDAVMKKIMVKS